MNFVEGEGNPPVSDRNFLAVLEASGVPYELYSFNSPAHHAREAAALLGCPLGAVVKSMIFQISGTDEIVLVLVSGQNLADIEKLSCVIGHQVKPAKAEEVFTLTGYPVGSVPPFAIKGNFPVIIDADLMDQKYLWAAAGSAYHLVKLTPDALLQLSGGQIGSIGKSLILK